MDWPVYCHMVALEISDPYCIIWGNCLEVDFGRYSGTRWNLWRFRTWWCFTFTSSEFKIADTLYSWFADDAITYSEFKTPLLYIVDSQTLVLLSEIRNGLLRGVEKARANIGTRLRPLDYYKPFVNSEIGIHAMGGAVGFNDFMEYLSQLSALRNEEWVRNTTKDLKH